MSRPVVLDLFCGAGGAAMGYRIAGFDVVGVDIDPQPAYPFQFIQREAFSFLEEDIDRLSDFDVIHASPPCQGYSGAVAPSSSVWSPRKGWHDRYNNAPRYIARLRTFLDALPFYRPYIIENVFGARKNMLDPVLLCGSMFHRPTPRHRLFETNWPLPQPDHPKCKGRAKRWAEARGVPMQETYVAGNSGRSGSIDTWKEIMEMPWALRAKDLSEAIYPVYTEYIGDELVKFLSPDTAKVGPESARDL